MPVVSSQHHPSEYQAPASSWMGESFDSGIETIDTANRVAVAQAGVGRGALNGAIQATPGGEHLRVGPPLANNVLGLELTLGDGSVIRSGAASLHDRLGAGLPGLLRGSSEHWAAINRIWYRLTPVPEARRGLLAAFHGVREACEAGLDILAAGISPTSMVGLDAGTLGYASRAGHGEVPDQAGAVLLIDLEGIDVSVDSRLRQAADLCQDRRPLQVETFVDPTRRAEIGSLRSAAGEEMERIDPDSHTLKTSVPRSTLADVLEHFQRLGPGANVVPANEFEIQDGTIWSRVVCEKIDPGQPNALGDLTQRMLEHVIEQGGVMIDTDDASASTFTPLSRMYDQATLETFERIDRALEPETSTDEYCFSQKGVLKYPGHGD